MGAVVAFWMPVGAMAIIGTMVGLKATWMLTRSRRVAYREWVARPANYGLGFGALGVPVGFALFIVANSGI